MLNLLHTFLNFIELNNSLNIDKVLLNNHKVKNKLNLDENLKLFLKNNKSIGSKDRKLFSNIFYTYYKEFKFIEYLANNTVNTLIKNETEKSLLLSDNQDQNRNLHLFLKFYLSIYFLNVKSNEIQELEIKYDFFELKKYYKLILSKVLNLEDELIYYILDSLEFIITKSIDDLEYRIETIGKINIITIDDFNTYIELLSIKYSFLDFNIIELIKSILNVNNLEEILTTLNNYDKKELIVLNEFINSNLSNLNSRANLFIRVIQNENLILAELDKSNIKYKKTLLPNAIQIENNSSLSNLDSFKNGLFEIQDLSSQLIFQFVKSFFIEKQSEDYNFNILDYCAGGGGKSLLFADELNLLNIFYNIIATDNNSKRLIGLKERLNKNVKINRNIKVINNEDFNNKRNTFKDKFDLIIIDAPCSGFGTVKRSPDNKYKYSLNDLNEFSNLQQNIIEECFPLLNTSGIIIYITCSLNYMENSNNLKEIEKKHKTKQNIKFLDIFTHSSELIKNQKDIMLFEDLQSNTKNNNGLTIYPIHFESDGFFVTLIQKIK